MNKLQVSALALLLASTGSAVRAVDRQAQPMNTATTGAVSEVERGLAAAGAQVRFLRNKNQDNIRITTGDAQAAVKHIQVAVAKIGEAQKKGLPSQLQGTTLEKFDLEKIKKSLNDSVAAVTQLPGLAQSRAADLFAGKDSPLAAVEGYANSFTDAYLHSPQTP